MKAIQIAVVNASGLADEDVAEGIVALQRQVSEDFAPVWGVDAELHLVTREETFRAAKFPDRWALVLEDHDLVTEQLGTNHLRGYHDLTSAGLPMSRVMVDQLDPGQDWTQVASHELLEMLADPDCNASVFRHPDSTTLLFYAREVCDPCAAYEDGYEKCGRVVSDFVFPTWFQPSSPTRGETRFDERGLIDEPFKVRPHGYIGVFQTSTSSWALLTSGGITDQENEVGSRMERRNTADNRWLDSDMGLAP
jgi:hypothetical protein